MESQVKNGNVIQEESILALKDILKELMAETNDLAFDIMPHSLMKKGVRDALHSLFSRIESDFDAKIDFDDEELKSFPIVKSAEIQFYRTIVSIYEKALERSKKLRSTFQLLSEPKVGLQLIIEQNDIESGGIAEKIVPTINKIAKLVRLVDGKFSVNYKNNKKTFEIQLTLPREYTQKATTIEEEEVIQ
jgi:signal transduction histidine kinase